MNLRTVYCFVRTVFLVTFKSLTVEETSFVSQIILDFDMYFNLRKFMSEIDLYGEIH